MTLQCLGGVGYRKENGGEKEKKTEDKGKKMLVYKQGPQINKVKKKEIIRQEESLKHVVCRNIYIHKFTHKAYSCC